MANKVVNKVVSKVVRKINLGKINKKLNILLKEGINEGLEILKEEAELLSPTDTKKFIKNHKIEKAKTVRNKVVGNLVNDTEYAVYLEYRLGEKKFKYHKGPPRNDTTVFYMGVGNRTYTRTYENKKDEVTKLIKSKLGLA